MVKVVAIIQPESRGNIYIYIYIVDKPCCDIIVMKKFLLGLF